VAFIQNFFYRILSLGHGSVALALALHVSGLGSGLGLGLLALALTPIALLTSLRDSERVRENDREARLLLINNSNPFSVLLYSLSIVAIISVHD